MELAASGLLWRRMRRRTSSFKSLALLVTTFSVDFTAVAGLYYTLIFFFALLMSVRLKRKILISFLLYSGIFNIIIVLLTAFASSCSKPTYTTLALSISSKFSQSITPLIKLFSQRDPKAATLLVLSTHSVLSCFLTSSSCLGMPTGAFPAEISSILVGFPPFSFLGKQPVIEGIRRREAYRPPSCWKTQSLIEGIRTRGRSREASSRHTLSTAISRRQRLAQVAALERVAESLPSSYQHEFFTNDAFSELSSVEGGASSPQGMHSIECVCEAEKKGREGENEDDRKVSEDSTENCNDTFDALMICSEEGESDASNGVDDCSRFKAQRYRFTLGFLGTKYHGSRRQADFPERTFLTVEDSVIAAIRDLNLVDRYRLQQKQLFMSSCSRTDRNVHACCFVSTAILKIPRQILPNSKDLSVLKKMMNEYFEKKNDEIYIFDISRVTPSFNARKDCVRREYGYLLHAAALSPPIFIDGGKSSANQQHSPFIPSKSPLTPPPHLRRIRAISECIGHYDAIIQQIRNPRFIGVHRFHNYSSKGATIVSPTSPNALRHIRKFRAFDLPITLDGNQFIYILIEGNSFVRHQIRKMISTAVELTRNILYKKSTIPAKKWVNIRSEFKAFSVAKQMEASEDYRECSDSARKFSMTKLARELTNASSHSNEDDPSKILLNRNEIIKNVFFAYFSHNKPALPHHARLSLYMPFLRLTSVMCVTPLSASAKTSFRLFGKAVKKLQTSNSQQNLPNTTPPPETSSSKFHTSFIPKNKLSYSLPPGKNLLKYMPTSPCWVESTETASNHSQGFCVCVIPFTRVSVTSFSGNGMYCSKPLAEGNGYYIPSNDPWQVPLFTHRIETSNIKSHSPRHSVDLLSIMRARISQVEQLKFLDSIDEQFDELRDVKFLGETFHTHISDIKGVISTSPPGSLFLNSCSFDRYNKRHGGIHGDVSFRLIEENMKWYKETKILPEIVRRWFPRDFIYNWKFSRSSPSLEVVTHVGASKGSDKVVEPELPSGTLSCSITNSETPSKSILLNEEEEEAIASSGWWPFLEWRRQIDLKSKGCVFW